MNPRFDCNTRYLLLKELEAALHSEAYKENPQLSKDDYALLLTAIDGAINQNQPGKKASMLVAFGLLDGRLFNLAKNLNLPVEVLSKLPKPYLTRLDILCYPLMEKNQDSQKGLSISQVLQTSQQALANLNTLYSLFSNGTYTYQEICDFNEARRRLEVEKLLAPKPQAAQPGSP